MLRHQKVFQRGHPAEQANVLEGAGDLGALGNLEIRHPLEQEDPVVAIIVELASGAGQRFDFV